MTKSNGKNGNMDPAAIGGHALGGGARYRASGIYERIAEDEMRDSLFEVEWNTARPPRRQMTEAYRLDEDQSAAWPLGPWPKGALRPKQGFLTPQTDRSSAAVAIVSMFGLNTDRLRSLLRQIETKQTWGAGFVPIFLTDNPNQELFRHAGYNLEYFPRSIYGSLKNRELFQERFRTICRKWKISFLIDFSGPDFLRERIDDLEALFMPRETRLNLFSPQLPKPAPTTPPPLDLASLQAEYHLKGLDRQRDTFVLYRILGNDLPPRHKLGQTLINLRFILENEPTLPKLSKRWVVNRIIDRDQEAAILSLLNDHKQPYLHIPFDLEEYAAIDWDIESFPQPAFFLRGQYSDMNKYDQGLAEYHLRRLKNRYVINNNGARNAALRDGRARGKWVLPWDGNCFLTQSAWNEIVDGVKDTPYFKYIVVPMARIMDNRHLLDDDHRPEALEEPQLIFRYDAQEEFNEEFFYGRRPKVEIFWRLGIPGAWDSWCDTVWDVPRRPLADEAGSFGRIGWVARLYSGQEELEVAGKAAMRSRGEARVRAVNDMIDALDHEAMAQVFDPKKLTAYDEAKIGALASAQAGSAHGRLFERLTLEADLALQRGPYCVTDKKTLAPSGDPHDYFNPAPYWWPNPDTPSGIPYVFKDGERIPGTRLYEPESDDFDRTRLQRMFDDTTVLALAWRATGKFAYAEYAATLVRHWFLHEETRMNPHLRYSQPRSQMINEEGSKSGLIEMKDLYYLLDAIRLVEQAGALSEAEKFDLREWLREYLEWLMTADQGVAERQSANNHGTCYDLQTASIAAFLGDDALLRSTFRTGRERLLEQFEPDGEQPHEMKRTQTAHYCCFNLQGWVNLAILADRCGDRLWQFEGQEGRGLARAFNWLLPYLSKPGWPYQQIEMFDWDRFLPLYFAAQEFCGTAGGELVNSTNVKPVFFPHDGIKPFWMLGATPRQPATSETWGALSETLEELAAPVAELVSATGFALRLNDSANDLDKKLWGGFSASAVVELEKVRHSTISDNRQMNLASRSLGRWYYTKREWDRALESLETMRDLDAVKERERTLVQADCQYRLGDVDAALDLAGSALASYQDDPDFCLVMANIHMGPAAAASACGNGVAFDWLNRIYLRSGFATFDRKNKDAGFSLENMCLPEGGGIRWHLDEGPKVSVIVPLAESHDQFPAVLASLLAQSWRNLEILLVGDRDWLNTLLAPDMADDRVTIVPSHGKSQEFELLNLGLAHASGTYVMAHRGNEYAHPEKLAAQINAFQMPEVHNVATCHSLVSSDFRFAGAWSPEFAMVSVNSSGTMYRLAAVRDMGGWDAVDPAPDDFLRWRFEKAFGEKSFQIAADRVPLSFTHLNGHSTRPTHVRFPYGKRRDELRRLMRQVKYRENASEAIAGPAPDPAFKFAPLGVCQPKSSDFDFFFVGDFSEIALGIEEIKGRLHQKLKDGAEIGIMHWPDYYFDWNKSLDEEISDLIDLGVVSQVSSYAAVTARTVVLCNPYLMAHKIDGLPTLRPERVQILCGPPLSKAEIFDGARRTMPRARDIEALFGAPCEWLSV